MLAEMGDKTSPGFYEFFEIDQKLIRSSMTEHPLSSHLELKPTTHLYVYEKEEDVEGIKLKYFMVLLHSIDYEGTEDQEMNTLATIFWSQLQTYLAKEEHITLILAFRANNKYKSIYIGKKTGEPLLRKMGGRYRMYPYMIQAEKKIVSKVDAVKSSPQTN